MRAGINGLSLHVQQALGRAPCDGTATCVCQPAPHVPHDGVLGRNRRVDVPAPWPAPSPKRRCAALRRCTRLNSKAWGSIRRNAWNYARHWLCRRWPNCTPGCWRPSALLPLAAARPRPLTTRSSASRRRSAMTHRARCRSTIIRSRTTFVLSPSARKTGVCWLGASWSVLSFPDFIQR